MRSPWDYTQKYDQFLVWLQEKVCLSSAFCNDAKTMEWNSHKSYLLDLQARSVDIVPTKLLTKGANNIQKSLEEIARKKEWQSFGDSVVVKPAVGSFGNDAHLVRLSSGGGQQQQQDVKQIKHLNRLLSEQDLLVQPFLTSIKTRGETSLVFVDHCFAHAVKKKPTSGDFKVQGGKIEPYDPSKEEIQLGLNTIHACHDCIYNQGKKKKPAADEDHHDDASKERRTGKQQLRGKKKKKKEKDNKNTFIFARVDLISRNDGHLLVSEVEILDPELFFRFSRESVQKMCLAIEARLAHHHHHHHNINYYHE